MTPNYILKDLRTRLGVSQIEFAKMAAIHRVHLCQLENGPPPRIGATIGLRLWQRFANEWRVMGIGLEDLLSYPEADDSTDPPERREVAG
jgi:transcriptional regulator with XRE-family HTH domain